MKRLAVFLLATLISAGTVGARTAVNERRDASPDGLVEIELVVGSIEVIGWDRDEIEVTGTLGDDRHELEISGHRDHITIEVDLPDGEHKDIEGSDLVIKIPRGSRVEVETVTAPIKVSGLTARVALSSVTGNIDLGGNPEEAEIQTVSGAIAMNDGAALKDGEFQSVSGDIQVKADFQPRGSFEFETVSGNIELRLPAGIGADFEVTTFSGNIENEFGPAAESTSSFLPAKELSFSTGSGGARISLTSFSGTVRIRKD